MIEATPLESFVDARTPSGLGGRWYGVYPAQVTDIEDPEGWGRVEVTLPWDTGDESYKAWARLATLMGGNDRGTWFVPDPKDEVLITFEGGDPRRPYVIGALWNGKDTPPDTKFDAKKNDRKVIRSRNGVQVTLDDTSGQEKMILETPGGQKVTLQDGGASVQIEDSNGNSVKLESGGVTVKTSAKAKVEASTAEITASMLTVNAGMSTFNGVVKADTVICDCIVATSYTPGAGNIW